MTTSPKRINNIKPVIDSLINQTIKPDKIFIHLPKIFKRSNEKFNNIPIFLKHDLIYINYVNDIGPITKILPIYNFKFPNNTLIISIDDDIIYDNNMINIIIDNHKKYPYHVLTNKSMLYKNNDAFMVAGFGGITYPYNIIKNMKINLNLPDYCYYSDDFIISNYLLNNNIPIKKIDYTIQILEYGLKNDALHKNGDITIFDIHPEKYKKCAIYLHKQQKLNNILKIWLDYNI